MSDDTTCPVRVQVGIDAAVVANPHVTIRTTSIDGAVQLSRFHVPPTIAGLRQLTQRLAMYPGVVAMDGFTGFKSASVEELPTAVEVMDPFHVVALAGQRLDDARQRIQQLTMGHRGRSGDALYGIRATLRCGYEMLRDKQKTRLEAVFTNDAHAVVEVTWNVYQNIIEAYRNKDRKLGKQQLVKVIDGSAAPPWGSGTWPTTSPDHSSTAEDSDPCSTLSYEEPVDGPVRNLPVPDQGG